VGICVALAFLGRMTPIKVLQSETTTPQVTRGGVFTVERQVKWLRPDCVNVRITAEFIDSLAPVGFSHNMPTIDLGFPRYELNTSRDWQVPLNMPWGEATYKSTLVFECFPFYGAWPITVELPPLKFAVVPSKGEEK